MSTTEEQLDWEEIREYCVILTVLEKRGFGGTLEEVYQRVLEYAGKYIGMVEYRPHDHGCKRISVVSGAVVEAWTERLHLPEVWD